MAGLFSSATVEQIRAASDIVDVIGSYLPLKRAGADFVALCPFHKEKTPSFHVNPHKQFFYCFGCQKGGSVFTFVQEHESIAFPEAVRRLAERAKIPLEYEQGASGQQTRQLKDTLFQIHEQIAERWHNALLDEPAGQSAREYLASRGVSAEAVQLFRLGCAPDLWDDTVNWARSKGYELPLVEKAGLVLRKEGTDHYYDRFRGRLLFPICDEQSRVIGFSGRILSGDAKAAKYVNSPETPIFTKSKVFFGLHKTKRAVLEAGFAIVCEGQLDLIAAFMAGVQNIVAPQGTAFTADHARILRRYVEEVVLCFDSDEAGQNAAVRALDNLLSSGLAVRVAVVPAPHDPDSFIKSFGAAAFRQLIEKAEGFFDYFLNRLCAAHPVTTDKGRLTVLRSMAEAVNKTANLVLIDTYAQKTALRLGVSADSVRQEFKRRQTHKWSGPSSVQEQPAPQQEMPRPTRDEFGLVQLLFQHEDLAPWLAANLDTNWLHHPLVQKIVTERVRASQANAWQGLPPFLDALADPQAHSLLTHAISLNYMEGAAGPQPDRDTRDHLRGRSVPKPFEDLRGLVTRLRNEHLSAEINRMAAHMVSLEAGSADQVETYRKIETLKALKRKPLELPAPNSSIPSLS